MPPLHAWSLSSCTSGRAVSRTSPRLSCPRDSSLNRMDGSSVGMSAGFICRPAPRAARDLDTRGLTNGRQALLQPSVAELIDGAGTPQNAVLVGVIQERHEVPRQPAGKRKPCSGDDVPAPHGRDEAEV